MKRDRLAKLAQAIAMANAGVAPGLRVVVCVTDESGDFVGVGMNVDVEDATAILLAAWRAEDARSH